LKCTLAENLKDPVFIRTFTLAVFSSAVIQENTTALFEVNLLKNHSRLMKTIFAGDVKSEVHAICALKALVCCFELLPSMLKTIFEACYDEDIISSEFHDQGDTKCIVIRRSLWGHIDTPCGQPAPSLAIRRA
jgi:hypothetical protein